MSAFDWFVLLAVLGGISVYGMAKSRGSKTMESYVKADNQVHWKAIGLSIMATQASAITFLSTPGQGFSDGMRYIQLYFGLPLAMIILSATILPKYMELKVFTAYEFLERRFDLRVRLLTAFLFLLQRGMASGLNIVAPAIVLSAVLNISLTTTTLIIGGLAILYTTAGGAMAVAQTQKLQMAVMLGGMVFILIYTILILPSDISLLDSMSIAGTLGRLNIVDFSLNPHERYTFWSGVAGGLMLSLSYFGTDQSQVQRYISGVSLAESRLGLLFNAVLKIPLQFVILLSGVMVFVYYQFDRPPLSFAPGAVERAASGPQAARLAELDERQKQLFIEQAATLRAMLTEPGGQYKEIARANEAEARSIAREVAGIVHAGSDTDFVFITFILSKLPRGLVGLLVAMIFCGAMSTASAELNSLGTTSVVDFYGRVMVRGRSEAHYVWATQLATALWGGLAMLFALTVPLSENLIQAINIIGSLFYGNLLGIFILALSSWKVRGTAVVVAAVLTEICVIALHFDGKLGFLWYNVVGCALVLALTWLCELSIRISRRSAGCQIG